MQHPIYQIGKMYSIYHEKNVFIYLMGTQEQNCVPFSDIGDRRQIQLWLNFSMEMSKRPCIF